MEEKELYEKLEKALRTLKKNRDNVPLAELKTKYKKGYDSLCNTIKIMASRYAALLALKDIRVHKDYIKAASPIINQAINDPDIIKQLSTAIFVNQDISEFEKLAFSLRERILLDLEPLYGNHTYLYITKEHLEEPSSEPMVYCDANGCFWINGKWCLAGDLRTGVLLAVTDKEDYIKSAYKGE